MAIDKAQIEDFKTQFITQLQRRGKDWGDAAIARWTATMAHPSFKDIQSEPNNIETPENLKMWVKAGGEVMANVEVVSEEAPAPAPVVETPPMPEPVPVEPVVDAPVDGAPV